MKTKTSYYFEAINDNCIQVDEIGNKSLRVDMHSVEPSIYSSFFWLGYAYHAHRNGNDSCFRISREQFRKFKKTGEVPIKNNKLQPKKLEV